MKIMRQLSNRVGTFTDSVIRRMTRISDAYGAKAIIICNPSNPCGKVFREDELLAIGKLALKYDAFVVTDEVYEHIL